MPKAQETLLEIDLKALKHNFEYLKSKLKKNTKFLAVVKAFAYGSDANSIANYLQDLNVEEHFPEVKLKAPRDYEWYTRNSLN